MAEEMDTLKKGGEKKKKKKLRDLARMSQMYWFAAVCILPRFLPKTFELNSLAITWYVM